MVLDRLNGLFNPLRMRANEMTKVLVAKHNKQGQPTKAFMVWATFRNPQDAYNAERTYKALHPTWKIVVR